jgi:hypothetical protein
MSTIVNNEQQPGNSGRVEVVLFAAFCLLFSVCLSPLAAYAQADTTGGSGGDTSGGSGSVSAAYNFQREGIFGCSYNGAYSMSVGAFAATGGTFVPVADATVELNTGLLVYQQCILREVIDRMRESVTSALVKQNITALLTGRGGAPLFPTQPYNELNNYASERLLEWLQNGGLASVNSSDQRLILSAVATGYRAALNPDTQLACPVAASNPLMRIATPNCNVVSEYWLARERANSVVANASYDLSTQWNWAQGFYPQQGVDPNGNIYTTAPGVLVDTLAQQTVQSGFNQLQSANDIGQMIGALFGGLGTQILASNQGLMGLTQPNAGQPSYLDQLAAESSAGLRNTAVNAAITQLSAAQQAEQMYFSILSQIAQLLTQSINQIRGIERQCWVLIQQKVCVSTSTAALPYNKCVDASGATITIATSTVFSQAVINAQIAPIATTTAQNLIASQNTLNTINQLIAGVTNTTSLDAQRIALQQLDTIINSKQLPTQADITRVQSQQQSVQAAMQTLLQNIPTTWGDGTPNLANPYDPNSGWCNVSNTTTGQQTVQMWDQLWQQQH